MSRIREVIDKFTTRAAWANQLGLSSVPCNTANSAKFPYSWAKDNTSEERWLNAAGTDVVRGTSVMSTDQFCLSDEVYNPMRKTVTVNLILTADVITQSIYLLPPNGVTCRIVGISEIHATAETTATALTAYVEKLTGTTAAGSGTTVMSGTFNLRGTANTQQTATLSTTNTGDSDNPDLILAPGDRLGLVVSAAGNEIAGVQITVFIAPCGNNLVIPVVLTGNGRMIDQHFFVADRDYIVTGAYWLHGTKLSVAGNLQITKCTGSAQAPASGTALLTNNTNAGFDLNAANNTYQTGTLVATAASLRLAPGNTLAFDFPATVTALAKAIAVVTLQPLERWKTVSFQGGPNASLADCAIFTADRPYQVMTASAIWSTAGASTQNVQLTRDTATDAPGAGTDLLSNDSNAGFQSDGTAHTTEVGTFKDTRFNHLLPGDRLSLDYSATTSLVGFVCTVGLKPE